MGLQTLMLEKYISSLVLPWPLSDALCSSSSLFKALIKLILKGYFLHHISGRLVMIKNAGPHLDSFHSCVQPTGIQ